jgi:hypothetical protein
MELELMLEVDLVLEVDQMKWMKTTTNKEKNIIFSDY